MCTSMPWDAVILQRTDYLQPGMVPDVREAF
jgi:hypothetical protein